MDLFLLLVSQIFDAFVEISNLVLIILDILVKFSNFSFIFLLEFIVTYPLCGSALADTTDNPSEMCPLKLTNFCLFLYHQS